MEKLHISQYIAKISDVDLMKAVEAYLEWQSGNSSTPGVTVIETSKKKELTEIDHIYTIYMEPLDGPSISGWTAAYDTICREIATRCYLGTFENRYNR